MRRRRYVITLALPLFVFYVVGVPLAVYTVLNYKKNLQRVRLSLNNLYQIS